MLSIKRICNCGASITHEDRLHLCNSCDRDFRVWCGSDYYADGVDMVELLDIWRSGGDLPKNQGRYPSIHQLALAQQSTVKEIRSLIGQMEHALLRRDFYAIEGIAYDIKQKAEDISFASEEVL